MRTKSKKRMPGKKTAKSRRTGKMPARSEATQSLYERFKPFIGMIKDGPKDLAENHKLYASGAKKWK